MRRTTTIDSLLIFAFVCVLIWPLFQLEYLDNWASIESTFIADARMLSNNLPHPSWQPMWYAGTRFDYIYPPALRFGTALIAKAGGVSTFRAYHLYTGIFYALGIVAVYWLVRVGTASRLFSWLAALATALLSPSYLLVTLLRQDSGYWVPQRLHVLMTYGEGPHISSLAVLPAALALTFVGVRKWQPAALVAAAVLCALVVANNFYGATALAILFPILVWAVWTSERSWPVWFRAVGIAVLAYGLSAFWLTPSFIGITLLNLKWVAQPGNTWSGIVALILVSIFCAISLQLGRGRPDRAWPIFVGGAAAVLSLDVLGLYYFGFRLAGEPHRLVPELDLILILALLELIRTLWNRPSWRLPLVIVLLLAFAPAARYMRHAWSPFPQAKPLEDVYEYQISKWAHDHLPGARVLASGSVRFWYNAWFDNAQIDGGSMQGMLNQILPIATWQVTQGVEPEISTLWLQALGTDAVIVPDKSSPEVYHDYAAPHKFQGALPVLYDDQNGTVIYSVPRVHPGIGRIVDQAALTSINDIRGGDDIETLAKYVAVIEDPRQPATTVTWHGFDDIQVQAQVAPGSSVLLQESFDPNWHAFENGTELAIIREPVMGFMLINAPPGNRLIQMHFSVPVENRAGQILFAIALIAMLALLIPGLVARKLNGAREGVGGGTKSDSRGT